MRRVPTTLLLTAVAGACAARPATLPEPEDTTFAAAYASRREAGVAPGDSVKRSRAREIASAPVRTAAEELRGLLRIGEGRLEELRAAAVDDGRIDVLLEEPLSAPELEALAWLRSPAVRAARERVRAVRTSIAQAADLRDLVGTYRAFLRDTKTRVGPEESRRATAAIAPSPNVAALSSAIVADDIAIAFQALRRAGRDTVASASRAHADAARLATARRILDEDIFLHERLVDVVRARVETGRTTQAALLAFQGRLDTLRVRRTVLDDEAAAVRARWNRLLRRPENADLRLDVTVTEAVPSGPVPDAKEAVRRALEDRPEHRMARLRERRARTAVRLAETMTLPRFDLGSSRFERERAGEASVQRGAVFPKPGRVAMPRGDFGVREAQITEMRARAAAATHAREASRDTTRTVVREALSALQAARRRWLVHESRLVPLARQAFDAARGAYEGNQTGYLEVLDHSRTLLDRRLRRADASRDHAHARAALLEAVGVRIEDIEERKK